MYKLIEVNNNLERARFLDIVEDIYKDDNLYLRPLDKDIENIFNPLKNKYYRDGEAIRWNLYDGHKHIGRVAAFYSDSYSFAGNYKVGGMGFFECINDEKAAYFMFDQCVQWLRQKNVQIMEGPVNFGERIAFWGLLVESHTEPRYRMNHHPAYYQSFFESYGFQLYFKQYSYGMEYEAVHTEKYYEKGAQLLKEPQYSFRKLDTDDLETYAGYFCHIYNAAWGKKHPGFKEMSPSDCLKMFMAFKPILVDYMMVYGFYDKEPISLFFAVPELNEYFRGFRGKLNAYNNLRFLYRKWMKNNDKFFGVVFGVVPAFQGQGVEGGTLLYANELLKGKQWKHFEMGWLGDFSPKMLHIAENLGGKVTKIHHTYRYMLDTSIPFERLQSLD